MKLHLVVGFFCFAVFSGVLAQIERPASCCLKLSSQLNKVSVNNVIDYTWQIKGVCPVTAVIVKTRRGKQLCADPNVDWTKRAISRVHSIKRRSHEEKNRKTVALTPIPPAEGNREEPPAPPAPAAPSDTPVYSRHPESPGPAAPTDQLKTPGKPVKTAQSSRRRGKGWRKRKTKSKSGKKKAKKTSQ